MSENFPPYPLLDIRTINPKFKKFPFFEMIRGFPKLYNCIFLDSMVEDSARYCYVLCLSFHKLIVFITFLILISIFPHMEPGFGAAWVGKAGLTKATLKMSGPKHVAITQLPCQNYKRIEAGVIVTFFIQKVENMKTWCKVDKSNLQMNRTLCKCYKFDYSKSGKHEIIV